MARKRLFDVAAKLRENGFPQIADLVDHVAEYGTLGEAEALADILGGT